jgi:hypothetical protein
MQKKQRKESIVANKWPAKSATVWAAALWEVGIPHSKARGGGWSSIHHTSPTSQQHVGMVKNYFGYSRRFMAGTTNAKTRGYIHFIPIFGLKDIPLIASQVKILRIDVIHMPFMWMKVFAFDRTLTYRFDVSESRWPYGVQHLSDAASSNRKS